MQPNNQTLGLAFQTFAICVTPPLLLAFVFQFVRKRNKRLKSKPAKQTPHRVTPALRPGNNTPLFHGVRVVEISSFIAGPSVGRCMSDLGAEVVKVEEPGGDLFRYTLLEYDQAPEPRDFSSLFELQNMGKIGVQLNLKSERGKAQLLKLLEEADVVVTNIRTDSLKNLRLDYDSLKNRFPHVVYGQVTAWGLTGSEHNKPGYDVGSFWAATGMAASVNDAPSFTMYPAGFGDLATSQFLLAGIAIGLADRMRTGMGQYVTTALLHSGLWCSSPLSLLHSDPGPEIPDYSKDTLPSRAVHHIYETKGNQHVGILDLDNAAESTAKLIQGFGLTPSQDEKVLIKQLQSELGQRSLEDLCCKLDELQVPHVSLRGYRSAVETTDHVACNTARCFDPVVPDLTDIPRTPRAPWELHCSTLHGPQGRAPFKGEHTDSFFRGGWSPVLQEAMLPKKPSESGFDLKKLIVVEFSETDCSVSGACCVLSDLGATVIKIEPREGDHLRRDMPQLFHSLNRGKHVVALDWTTPDGKAALQQLVCSADVFVTNRPVDELKSLGLEYHSTKQVYGLVTPFGNGGPSNVRGAVAPLYLQGGVAGFMGGTSPSSPPQIPEQFFELLGSAFVVAGVCLGLFHKARTGEGQLVELNYLRLGAWCSQVFGVLCHKDSTKYDALILPPSVFANCNPVVTYNSFQTRDGMWVQLLGVDMPRHISRTLRSLGIVLPTCGKVVWSLLTEVLPNTKVQSPIIRLRPVFWVMNASIRAAVASLTWAQLQTRFDKYDVWHCPVRMPRQVIGYKQAHEIGVFLQTASKQYIVSTPLQLSGFTHPVNTRLAKVGEDNVSLLSVKP
eukprot:c2828_g1_i1.p1 GENE.c2828_g1_i1~~c2828_g1_i1.p1  ORF type:complete len:840 (+),score=194.56 c2828_g1_i1:50-2569(+)